MTPTQTRHPAVTRLHDLSRAYEERHFPPARRLDLQAESPRTGRARALRWIQMWAHELPGAELLLVVERGRRPGRSPGPVQRALEGLLDELSGGLVDWWQEFGSGSLALGISDDPDVFAPLRAAAERERPRGEGRTPETSGALTLEPEQDIPPELLPDARRAAELRREREGLSPEILSLLLREVWVAAQAAAMEERVSFAAALADILAEEEARRAQ